MKNMACEQWCYLAHGYILGFTLCLVLGSSIAEPDDFYNYKSFDNDESNGIEHVFHTEELNGKLLEVSREKRHLETPPSIHTTVSPVLETSIYEIPLITTKTAPIAIVEFDNITNKTFTQNNITRAEEDTHQYYNSTFIVDENIGRSFWVDLENHPDKKVNDLLSASYRRVANVQLKFDFPFYGHKIRNITIATGGFLYTGEVVHRSLTATQYIAPLMANFNTRLSNDSYVKYADNGTAFTVEWEKVVLQDKQEAGPFTFQATLHKNGNIVFVYAQMPLSVKDIEDKAHPVKVGLSDAYIMDRTVFFVQRKTIYEYHRVNFNRRDIRNWTVIYLRALPNCLQMENCTDCLTKVPDFACKWCPELNQCSTGIFRNRQAWLQNQCEYRSIKEEASCPTGPEIFTNQTDDHEDSRVISETKLSASAEPNRLPRDLSLLEQNDFYNLKRFENDESNGIEHVFHTEELNDRLLEMSRQKRHMIEPPSTNTRVFPVSQTPIYEIPLITTESGRTANVTYSIDNATHSIDEPSINLTISPTIEQEPEDIGENTTAVSMPPTFIRTFNDTTNETLTYNTINSTGIDKHQYYNSTFIVNENIGKNSWVDLENHPDKKVIDLLSAGYRRVAPVQLKFDFPFYGHKIRNLTIATGGFLYAREKVHPWLPGTQYITPLMINFDTRFSKASSVKYSDNSTAFTIEWENVVLHNKPEVGPFTFQATLHENGDIVFVYKQVPIVIEKIGDETHHVRMGLSEIYIMDRIVFFERRKTIYEYHRMNFNHQNMRNWTIIYFRAQPTCLHMKNCTDCLTKVPELACKWCPELNQCGSYTSGNRQDWLQKKCDQWNIKEPAGCPAESKIFTNHTDEHEHSRVISEGKLSTRVKRNSLSRQPNLLEQSDFYNYKSLENEESNGIEYVFHTEELNGRLLEVSRQKRYVEPSPSMSTTVSPFSQNPIHDIPVIKTETGSTANVTYSTDNATNSTEEPSTNSTVSSTIKQEPGKNTTVVSMTSTSTIAPIIWANQTLWPNATKERTLSKDDNRTTKINITRTTDISTNSSEFDDISITKFNDVTNNTLTQNNITKTEEDTHQYYNSTFIVDENIGRSFWVDLENHPDKKVNDLLSASHRRAATVKLKFDFPFYGHKVRNITIATGGFLYTGEFVHSWLAATQYIAPLMANFDTRLSKDSYVKYADNGTAFTVEWEKVVLQDKQGAGPFTFQATLHENGNIVFVYAQMPLLVEDIEDKAHPVKVGLSDAYIMDRTVFFVRRKTIYEYHRVNFNRQDIRNWTVIYLRALPTCLQMDNCTDCLTKVPDFACKWCPELNQCSTGTFRNRQDWLHKNCEQRSIKEEGSCPAGPKTFNDHTDEHEHPRVISEGELSASVEPNRLSKEPNLLEQTHGKMNMTHMGVSGIIGILLIVSLIAGLAGWAAYAYRNPHSASGQMLIRYRPSQWTWRRGEARYTAATIHM